MCGIAGTVFNANFFQGEEITILDLKRSIEGFKNNTNNSLISEGLYYRLEELYFINNEFSIQNFQL